MNIFSNIRTAVGALFTRWGGQGYTRVRLLLPGSRLDYQTEAGDLWSNSIVALGIKWLGDRFPRPMIQVSAISRRGDYVPLPSHPMLDLWRSRTHTTTVEQWRRRSVFPWFAMAMPTSRK